MKILFVGKTDFQYNRTAILIEGLRALKEVEVNTFQLFHRNASEALMLKSLSKEVDCVVVPAFRHNDLGFVKSNIDCLLIYDALLSEYLTKVIDYKQYWKAPFKYFIDYTSLHKADMLIADTRAYANYLSNTFRYKKPIVPIYVGVDLPNFKVSQSQTIDKKVFKVGFYGSFNPLQGINVIVQAAKLLENNEDIQFYLIGGGATMKSIDAMIKHNQLNNIHFMGWKPKEELGESMADFEVCLGIFGESAKVDLVVPNKVFHYAALAKPIISKQTKAMQEVFTDTVNIQFSDGTPNDLASQILFLKAHPSLSAEMGNRAHELMQSHYSERHIAQEFYEQIFQYIS